MQCSFFIDWLFREWFEDAERVEQMSEMSEYYRGTPQRQLFPL
jgi:hypothetical protein